MPIGLNIGAGHRRQASIHIQHGGFNPIEAFAHLRKSFTRFVPKGADLALQTPPKGDDFAFQPPLDVDQ
ncbi:MAG TPA: hypothetical protein VN924_26205 [Bryobacteraceae bacterium]|nr:hypothetical protein [Bryobacteraceae bacterium]